MNPLSWTITEEHADIRLDHFLTSHVTDQTRSALQKLIKNHRVTVNDKPATVHRFLKEGDVVKLADTIPVVEAPNQADEPVKPLLTFKIIKETPDWMVINKPAGLLVHADTKTQHGTLVDLLLAHDPKIIKVGERPESPGIVHRLDREVSGLMVVAKTQAAYENLQKQFASRVVEKHYLAFCHGEFSQDEGDIKFKIARSTSKARMAARPVEEESGKAAWTHYRVKEKFVGAALVDLQIFSGRTHQIRAHLHALSHPVIGDELYKLRRTDRSVLAPRLMLQSVRLSFADPATGEAQAFEIDPDPSFEQLRKTFTV